VPHTGVERILRRAQRARICADGTSRRPFPNAGINEPTGWAGGRPPAFDRVAYRRHNIVERRFNRLKL